MTDDYVHDYAFPPEITDQAGPNGPALVRVYGEKTQEGWGIVGAKGKPGFMPRYTKGEFLERKALYTYEHNGLPFALVMRSLKLVVVDIDGKNDGFEGAKNLGNLPPTLAETSKSGNGYHLFFLTPEDEWDSEKGYAAYSDRIGIAQGVDFRAVGCVFHHLTQRWNGRAPAPLPDHLAEILRARQQQQVAAHQRIIAIREGGDDMEVLMLKDELISDLRKPIPDGKRNTTLFAIGTKLLEAEVDGWDVLLKDRAIEVGLEEDEADKIVANVERYGSN